MQKNLNSGFIHDSQAPDPIVIWETPVVTEVQRAAFGALRPVPGIIISDATEGEWDAAVIEFKQHLLTVSKTE